MSKGGATSIGAQNMKEGAPMNLGFIVAIVAVATIGGFMFGYDSGVINGTQEGLERAFATSKLGTGFNVGALLLGCAVGAFAAGRVSDVLGRRGVMRVAAVLFIMSALGAGAAGSSLLFVIARFVGGAGVGAASVLSPAYISEVTPAGIRGRLSSVQQIMIITGITGAFLVNYALAHWAGSSLSPFWLGLPTWRWMFWAQMIPSAIYFVALLFIPESPRFLVVKGREAEAERVLARLTGAVEAKRKVVEIRASLAKDHRPKLADLKDPATGRVRKLVWTGIGLAVFQQLVGINIIYYYGSVLWQSVGFSEDDALKINVISGVAGIAACLATFFLIDRIGRKPLLLIGSAGMAVTLTVIAASFSTGALVNGTLQLSSHAGLAALLAANAYVIFFNVSWGPVMWVMLGEMFPNQLRGSGLAVSGLAQWLANFAVSASFPALAVSIGLVVTYGFCAVAAVVSFFFVRTMVQETRGIELEQMRA